MALKTVASFRDVPAADLACSRLEADDIPAVAIHANHVRVSRGRPACRRLRQLLTDRQTNLEIALHDPNNCLTGDVHVASTTLAVEGVLLHQVVPVVDGTGLAFRVSADGEVMQ